MSAPAVGRWQRERQRRVVCRVEELPPGRTKLHTEGARQVIVANLPEIGLVALSNYCSHQGGPLSGGSLEAMWVGDEVGEHRQDPKRWVFICPYHNFETDAQTGCPVARLGRLRTATYRVAEEAGEVVVYF